MKIKVLILLLLTASLLSGEIIDRVVAKAGKEIILQSELNQHLMQMKQFDEYSGELTEIEALNDLIESKLVIQAAKERDFRVDDYRIKQMIDNQINQQIRQLGSETALRNELAKYNMTILDFRSYLDKMLREQRLKEMIIASDIKKNVTVSDNEAYNFYNENYEDLPLRPEMVEVGMIVKEIVPSAATKKSALKEINKIYDQLRDGADFEELAKSLSECPSSRLGGDLGFFGKGAMVKEFEEVAFSLKVGEISRVVETTFGYHIIQMIDKENEDIRVRHILKMVEPTEEDIIDLVAQMQNILAELRAGADFAVLAEIHSDDETAASGGVIGKFTEETIPDMFKSSINKIDTGEVTDIIREEGFLYIFGKLRKIPEGKYDYEDIREQLKEMLLVNKQAEQYEKWIDDLRNNSYVEIFLD